MADKDPDLISAWESLMPLFLSKRDQYFEEVGRLGITPPHGQAMMALTRPRRMRELADLMTCDASYVTAVVDRLESLGLAERRPSTEDRRVKEVALTAAGESALRRLRSAMSRPPEALLCLPEADRRSLVRILRKLPPPPSQVGDGAMRWGPPRA